MKIHYELSDLQRDPGGWTFNYSWVRSGHVDMPDNASDLMITRKIKSLLEIAGLRSVPLWDHWDEKAYRIRRTTIGFSWRVE